MTAAFIANQWIMDEHNHGFGNPNGPDWWKLLMLLSALAILAALIISGILVA